MADLENPLSNDDFDRLEAQLAETSRIDKAINRAKQAGIEIDGALEQNRENRRRIQGLLNTFKRPQK